MRTMDYCRLYADQVWDYVNTTMSAKQLAGAAGALCSIARFQRLSLLPRYGEEVCLFVGVGDNDIHYTAGHHTHIVIVT